jgi:hypothetical protein
MDTSGIPVAVDRRDCPEFKQEFLLLALLLEDGSVSGSTVQTAPLNAILSSSVETGLWPVLSLPAESRFVL